VSNIFTNPNQLEEWVDASMGIQERFGIEKALGYVIGEKVYNLVAILHSARTIIRAIDEQRRQPEFTPVRVTKYSDREIVTNLDEIYEKEKGITIEAEDLLVHFVFLIEQAFLPHEIRRYLASHPRLGVHEHISTDEQFDFMVSRGAVEHTIDTEVEDALIFGDMLKYFGINA